MDPFVLFDFCVVASDLGRPFDRMEFGLTFDHLTSEQFTVAQVSVLGNPLGVYPDASLIINPPDSDGDGVPDSITPVATEETRFGGIKARF